MSTKRVDGLTEDVHGYSKGVPKDHVPLQRLQSPSASDSWATISKSLPLLDPHVAFWWRTTGASLSIMLECAGYDYQVQKEKLLFYYRYICPSLGPSPTIDGRLRVWESFMTDDFSPLEYSWKWGQRDEPPVVRFSIEAIGEGTGTVEDPLNRKMTMNLIQNLRTALPGSQWDWPDALCKEFLAKPEHTGFHSTMFLGFELEHSKNIGKVYFLPPRSVRPNESMLTRAIKCLRRKEPQANFGSFYWLEEFLNNDLIGSQLRLEMLAVDCVAHSRFKTYVRCTSTSFDAVRLVLTLNGKLHGLDIESSLRELRELWHLVLNLDEDFPSFQTLPSNHHPTSGILYYFDTKPNSCSEMDVDIIEPKVYIPVKHYAHSDRTIAEGLQTFLIRRQRASYINQYLKVLDAIGAHRSLNDGCGLQTYISCGLKDGSLAITSYLGPEIYHSSRRLR